MLQYDLGKNEKKNWLIAETAFDIRRQGKCESIFCLGSGYLGQRAAFEEKYVGQTRDMLINGTFNRFDKQEVTELPNAPDVTNLELTLDGERFSMDSGRTEGYLRVLDLRTGELTRSLTWTSPAGKRYRMEFARFVSLSRRQVLGQRAVITPLDGPCELRIDSGIDGQVTNGGSQHFHEGAKRVFDRTVLRMTQRTTQSDVTVCVHTAHRYFLGNDPAEGKLLPVIDRRILAMRGTFGLQPGIPFRVEKLTAVTTGRDLAYAALSGEDAASRAEEDGLAMVTEALSLGYDALFAESQAVWDALWNQADIAVDSEREEDQLLLRFALYHLNIMASKTDSRMGIGAKGLSGEGYKGHSFWDTEIFTLPYFTLTQPGAARKLMEYRFLGLDGARRKARENGFRGAMYPWEAAWIDDGETTPLLGAADIVTGKPIPILTGLLEQHITADVAFGVWQYYTVTGDRDFMDRCGWEILLETGRFWASRAEWIEASGRYEIRNVIGPDEYKDHVDNNAYTNYMAAYNMRLALRAMNVLEAEESPAAASLRERFPFGDLRKEILPVLDRLYLPQPDENGIIPQFDGYFALKHLDLTPYRNAGSVGSIYNDYNQDQICTFQVHKQADTVVLLLLLDDLFPAEIRKKNYYFYEARTLHDSSLSKSTHCVLAADLGEDETAYRFFEGCGNVDFGPNMGTSDAGIHTASMGGIWQCAVYGFGGVRVVGEDLTIAPRLPKAWRSLCFRLVWRGQPLSVSVCGSSLRVENRGAAPVRLLLYGRPAEILPGAAVTASPA